MKASARRAKDLEKNPKILPTRVTEYVARPYVKRGAALNPLNDSSLILGTKGALGVERALSGEEKNKSTIPPALLPPQSSIKIEGFDAEKTAQIDPMQAFAVDSEIKSSPMSNIEKAKKLKLLRKHGRVALDQ